MHGERQRALYHPQVQPAAALRLAAALARAAACPAKPAVALALATSASASLAAAADVGTAPPTLDLGRRHTGRVADSTVKERLCARQRAGPAGSRLCPRPLPLSLGLP